MPIDILHDRLMALQETMNHLGQLIDRLANLDFSSSSGPSSSQDDAASAATLSTEIGQMIRDEEDELELLQEEILDVRSGRPGSETERERLRLKEGVARLEQELQSYHTSFRKAQIVSRRNLQHAQRLARENLLQSWNEPVAELDGAGSTETTMHQPPTDAKPPGYHRPTTEPSLLSPEDQRNVSASSNVTQALREMHEMMASELTKSNFARETLDESTRMMKSLGESYDSLDSVVASSVNLVGALMRSQKSDTWYLKTSFYMLAATLGWLVFRRWLYGPLWWLVWLPLRLLLGVSWKTGQVIVASSSGHRAVGPAGGDSATVVDGRVQVEGLPDGTLPVIKVDAAPDEVELEWAKNVTENATENDIENHPREDNKDSPLEKATGDRGANGQGAVREEAQEKDEL